ncbi:DUF1631 domain-containing protein [Propionivibrio soli]|uniref:DUF1631 domain-containing protein n=1 Tax=Propionivibrio soli TaxID=2976531 RepID=UPI0021E98359|nr:DUF1631 domain-containing protein [Propionivibrio soli]
MNESSLLASNRVVSLNTPGRARSPGLRLLGECRDQLVEDLCDWLRSVATPIAEELFVLADSTRDRLLQTRYLDLRADVEKNWPHLVETFRRELSAEAERCQNQDAARETGRDGPFEIPDFEGLQLVADEDLSEHIVIREFSAQLSESCDEELYTLNRRVAALLGVDEIGDNRNPLAPSIVCRAISDACGAFGADAESRLILLRRLERHLHASLPPVYRRINAYLVERGILPDLKRTYRRSAGEANAPTSTPAASSQAGSTTMAPTSLSGEGVLDALQRLAQARMAQMAANPLSAAHVSGTPGTTQAGGFGGAIAIDQATVNSLLLSSLNELQHAVPAVGAGNALVNQVRQVRESENARQVGALEAVTIDIVAMLFDFILDDPHVPVATKALISRLQIPVLKVAMLDPAFFSDRQHPTRRFLSSISGISVRWGDGVDETDPFYRKLADLVERIQVEFESDVEVFGRALAELEAFVAEREKEEDKAALPAANVVLQREREAAAMERAQSAVRAFRGSRSLPLAVVDFLGSHWTRVLQAVALDENDSAWNTANAVMSDLAWSIEPKKSPDDRFKLVSLLPKMLAELNRGLDRAGVEQSARAAFFDALVKFHSAALKGDLSAVSQQAAAVPAIASEETPKPSQEGDLLVTSSVGDGVEVKEVVLVGASPIWRADDREIFRQVGDLCRGDWVEFRDDQGASHRERLTWISPQRGILLFSNHRSSKAISITPDALARQIRDGNAAIVHEEQIFERALSGALESMNAA